MTVAILAAPDADKRDIAAVMGALERAGGVGAILSPDTIGDTSPTFWDAVYVAGGTSPEVAAFVKDAFRQSKPIGSSEDAAAFVMKTLNDDASGKTWPGIVKSGKDFVKACVVRRYWERSKRAA